MRCSKLEISMDAQGYLINPQDWSEELAVKISRLEGLILSEAHWQVIYFLRAFYMQYKISPTVRMLLAAISNVYGAEKWNSRYLFYLFPQGPAKQATKIAGLPKTVKCL
ncbi:TusE/DsrC/DsvC family sulfur relay protein [Sodalis endosymbiont of Henestaris halophilus]|uniref:TusE/DsrC/DsvC family sulfur relay protein n=1 Tax=Sodalis endosymbiont of Henestaris halophilus TaxID=1929246 RepID=UPI000BBF82F9|nr:TusE/DsrC/DsvC family sulfur relay protein [Sodalis endosymbiont of Henestaris halophilus]SNC58416.1 Sulfurtransferase TusE [Sodalis endosymbiont of Henestaris halophilus]